KLIARVEKHSGDSDRRHPKESWRFHPFSKRLFANNLAGVFASVTDNGPAIVGATLDDVDFVSTHRSVLTGPDLTRLGVNRHSLRIPVSVRVDFRLRAGTADERIVGGDSALLVKSDDLSIVIAEILRERFRHRTTVANRCVKHSILVKNDTAAHIETALSPCVRHEHIRRVHP